MPTKIGRPPVVTMEPPYLSVTVSGDEFHFRMGTDHAIRRVHGPALLKDTNYLYAQQQAREFAATQGLSPRHFGAVTPLGAS